MLPVYNEEQVLERSVRTLHAYLTDNLRHDWRIVIADNGSKDRTPQIGKQLEGSLPNVVAMHIPEAGRGRALTRAWLASDAASYVTGEIVVVDGGRMTLNYTVPV